MLDAVNGDRPGQTGDIENALDPQHILPMHLQQQGQPNAEDRPVERARKGHGESVYARIMLVLVATLKWAVRDVMMAVIVMTGPRFGSQPSAYFRGSAGRVESVFVEEHGERRGGIGGAKARRGGIYSCEPLLEAVDLFRGGEIH